MFDEPKTLAEAKKLVYGRGQIYVSKYEEGRCAGSVFENYSSHQCSRKNGHGPEGLYCRQHAIQVGHVEPQEAGRDFIYAVDVERGKPFVEAFRVQRTTDKKVFIEKSCSAFRYRNAVLIEDVHWTPEAAAEAWLKLQRKKFLDAQDEVNRIGKAVVAAEALLKKTIKERSKTNG